MLSHAPDVIIFSHIKNEYPIPNIIQGVFFYIGYFLLFWEKFITSGTCSYRQNVKKNQNKNLRYVEYVHFDDLKNHSKS